MNIYQLWEDMLDRSKKWGAKMEDIWAIDDPKKIRFSWVIRTPSEFSGSDGAVGERFDISLFEVEDNNPELVEWLSIPKNREVICDPAVLELLVLARQSNPCKEDREEEALHLLEPTHTDIVELLKDMRAEALSAPDSKILPCDDPRALQLGWIVVRGMDTGHESSKLFTIKASSILNRGSESLKPFSTPSGRADIATIEGIDKLLQVLA